MKNFALMISYLGIIVYSASKYLLSVFIIISEIKIILGKTIIDTKMLGIYLGILVISVQP